MKSQAQDIISCVQWKTRQERILVSSGGVDPRDAEEAAAAQTGIAGTGITVFAQIRSASNAVPPPPPETFGASLLAYLPVPQMVSAMRCSLCISMLRWRAFGLCRLGTTPRYETWQRRAASMRPVEGTRRRTGRATA